MTSNEKLVIRAIIEGHKCPNRERYLQQLEKCKVVLRKDTGCGFFYTLRVDGFARTGEEFQLPHFGAEVTGVQYGIGFILYIKDGWLHKLEGFTYEGDMPKDWADKILAFTRGEHILSPLPDNLVPLSEETKQNGQS